MCIKIALSKIWSIKKRSKFYSLQESLSRDKVLSIKSCIHKYFYWDTHIYFVWICILLIRILQSGTFSLRKNFVNLTHKCSNFTGIGNCREIYIYVFICLYLQTQFYINYILPIHINAYPSKYIHTFPSNAKNLIQQNANKT